MAQHRYKMFILLFITSISIVYSIYFLEYVPSASCQQEKMMFSQTRIGLEVNISKFSCLKSNDRNTSVASMLVAENFEGMACRKRQIRFADVKMPQIALASFPGSGNTWVRHLIEQISGIATGSRYCGPVKDTFIGECNTDTSRTIVIKTHNLVKFERNFYKALLILRNPFDTILAEFNRRKSNKTCVARQEYFKSENWTNFVTRESRKWRQFAISWMTTFRRPLHVIFYEQLKNNLAEELVKLSIFLRVNTTFHDIWCATRNQKGVYYRIKPAWLKPAELYSQELKDMIKLRIYQTSFVLKQNFLTKEVVKKFDELYNNRTYLT